jgi:hypothetical protein
MLGAGRREVKANRPRLTPDPRGAKLPRREATQGGSRHTCGRDAVGPKPARSGILASLGMTGSKGIPAGTSGRILAGPELPTGFHRLWISCGNLAREAK